MFDAKQATQKTLEALKDIVEEVLDDVEQRAGEGFFDITYYAFDENEKRAATTILIHSDTFESLGYTVMREHDDRIGLSWPKE